MLAKEVKELQCELHPSQTVISICLDKKCTKSRACCFLCTQEHLTHFNSLIPLNDFTNFAYNLNDQQIQAALQNNSSYKYLNKLKEQVTNLLDLINKELENTQELFVAKALSNRSNCLDSKQSLEELIKLLLPISIVKNNHIICNENQSVIYYPIEKLISSLEVLTQKDFIKLKDVCLQEFQIQFSKEYKHQEITINQGDPSIITKNGGSYGIAYGEAQFNLKTDNFNFSYKILTPPKNIWVGVGSIVDKLYLFNNFPQIGHFQYMVSFHKFCFHHTNKNQNHTLNGFAFTKDDIINVQYNVESKSLKFSKINPQGQQEQTVTMLITEVNQTVRPVVRMQSGDSVKLLDQNEQHIIQ